MKYYISALTLLVLALFLSPVDVFAEDHKAIVKRISLRAKVITPLKKQGLLGEGNKGYLLPRGSLNAGQRKIMAEENKDRATLYAIAAARAGGSKVAIGVARARQINQRSGKGIWLQGVDGIWYKK